MLQKLQEDICEFERKNSIKPALIKMDKTFYDKVISKYSVIQNGEYKTAFGVTLEVVNGLGEDYIVFADEYEIATANLFTEVDKVIGELIDINKQYANWDAWDKTKIIDSALNILKEGYKEELEDKYRNS
jgi:hypothetical protein